jgi:hypothetical protein
MGRIHVGGLVAAAVVGVLGAVTIAAPPPKKQPTPATMTFRCLAGEPDSASCGPLSDSDDTDRVRDDTRGSYTGGNIDTGGVFNVGFAPVTRVLNLYLGTRVSERTCTTTGNCHPRDLEGADLPLDYFQVRVKPLTANWSQDLAGGLYAMTICNAGYPALVDYTFWLPDGDGHWGLNFNPKAYPGTTPAELIRLTDTKWTVEAMGDTAELLSWEHSGITRHNGPSHEGKFIVPFKFTIEATGALPSGAGTCN